MEWKNIYRGFAMGVCDLVPGISGGTVAVLLGFYDRLIEAINGIFSREWKRHFAFLIPLGIGMVSAIFILGRVMEWLLENHEVGTMYFFVGLIVGVLPFLLRESDAKRTFAWKHYLFVLVGIGIIFLIDMGTEKTALITDRSLATYGLFFVSGVLASAAMILPGISGSFVLLVLGVYYTAIGAVVNLELTVIITVAAGIFIGIITMSKIIRFCLHRYKTATFAIIIGLVIGSVFAIFPGIGASATQIIAHIGLLVAGLIVAVVLGKVEYQ